MFVVGLLKNTFCVSARLFTIYVDSADTKLMINFAVSSILSSGVLFTAFYYKSKEPQQKQRKSSDTHNHCHQD